MATCQQPQGYREQAMYIEVATDKDNFKFSHQFHLRSDLCMWADRIQIMDLKLQMNVPKGGHEIEEEGQPVSPVSQCFKSPLFSLCVHVIFELQESVTDIPKYMNAVAESIMSTNPLYSCIMKKDDRGSWRWKKTKVNTDDITFVAELPPGQESYDAWVDDYISKLSLTPLDQSRPLWEIHFLNYKTSKAAATMVIKLHHSLGDGVSFMATLFSMARRVDNPEFPPTFPTAHKHRVKPSWPGMAVANFFQKLWYMMLVVWYSVVDLIRTTLRLIDWLDDSQLPIRGPPGVEYTPVALSSATFLLEDIKQIKNSVGGTVNDVITGIIFYGIQRYLQIHLSAVGEHSLQDAYEKRLEQPKDTVIKQIKNSRLTAICMMNMRPLAGLQNIEEMLKPKGKVPWGNRVGFLCLLVPMMGKLENPLEFLKRIKRVIDRNKISLATYINYRLGKWLARKKGPQALSKCLYNTVVHTTMVVSNMIGPMEKIAMAGNPVNNFTFFVSGLPQALGVFIVSYMGSVVLQVHAHKDYVDAHMLCKCFVEASKEMKNYTLNPNPIEEGNGESI